MRYTTKNIVKDGLFCINYNFYPLRQHYECPPNLQYRPGNSRTRLADGPGRPANPAKSGTSGRGRQTNGRSGNGAVRSEGKTGTRSGVAPRDASLVYQ